MEGLVSAVSIAQETTYGTAVTPTTTVVVKPSAGFRIAQGVKGVEAIDGRIPKNRSFYKDKALYPGSLSLDVAPLSIGYFLKSLFGGYGVATVEAGAVFKHSFTEAITKPSLTIEQKMDIETRRYAGCIAKSMKFSAKVGSTLDVAAELQAKSQAIATPITAVYDNKRPLNFVDVNQVLVNGTDLKAYIDSIELEFDNSLEMFHGLGSADPANRYVKPSLYKGKMNLYYDTNTKNLIVNQIGNTALPLDIIFQGDAIGASSNDKLRFYAPKCTFKKYETKLETGYNQLVLEFESAYDVATSQAILVELTNVLTTY
jgi:hypothetical protein